MKDMKNDFVRGSSEAWKEQIIKDLKGKDISRLTWKSPEGIEVAPFYTSETTKDLSFAVPLSKMLPYLRQHDPETNDWYVRQDILVSNENEANKKAKSLARLGVNELGFFFTDGRKGFDPGKLLNGLDPTKHRLCFSGGDSSPEILENFMRWLKNEKIPSANLNAGIEYDPLEEYLITGLKDFPEKEIIITRDLVKKSLGTGIRSISISGFAFANMGANITEELGFSLAMASDYISVLSEMGLEANDIASKMQFKLGTGSNYFFEIAKIRALRWLWLVLTNAFSINKTLAQKLHIQAIPSSFNKTILDPYVNMLRYTTEALSSAIGGADSINIFPFNSVAKTSGAFSERIARNTQIILKEESYINKINDPAAGSYYIEELTSLIANETWNVFLNIEAKGGFIEALKNGLIKEIIEKSHSSRLDNINSRKEILLGTNNYPDISENHLLSVDPDSSAGDGSGYDINKRFHGFRGAGDIEKLRDAVSLSGGKTAVLFPFGDTSTRSARITFSSNFIGCSGIRQTDLTGIKDIEEGIKKCNELNPAIIVFCSSDNEYAQYVPSIIKKLTGKTVFVIAGNPVDSNKELVKAGVTHFIHIKSNLYSSLSHILRDSGIKLPQ